MAKVAIDIREATIGDVGTLAEIGSSSFREAYGPHSSTADLELHIENYFSLDAVRADLERHGSNYLVAMVDDEVGGIAKFRHAPCPVPGGNDNAFEIQQLYILAAMQGYGLGFKLVESIVDAARSAKVKGVWLSAWEFADWATGFYRRVGFNEIGKVEFKLGSKSDTDLLMWKSLE